MAHMQENIGANNVKFSTSELQELNSELNKIEIKGERLPESVLQFSGVEAPFKK